MSFIKRHLKFRIRFNAAAMHYYNDDFSKTRPSDEDDHSEIHETIIILRSDTGAQLRNVESVLVDKIISENRYGNLGRTLDDVIRSYSQQLEAAPQVTGDASLLPLLLGSESNDVSIWWLVGLCSILPNFPLGTILCFLSFWYFQRQSSRNVEGYELKKSERDTTAFIKWFLLGIIATPILYFSGINNLVFYNLMMGTTKEEWDVKNAEEERIKWARMREAEQTPLDRVLDGSDPNSEQIKRTLCLRYTNYDPGCLKP